MRTTLWTDEQKEAIVKLETEGRIRNHRPCGCFDIHVTDKFFVVAFCDTCRDGLTKLNPDVFGEA